MSKLYLILGSDRTLIAKGSPVGPVLGETLQLKILEQKAQEVAGHQILILMSEGADQLPVQCHLVERTEDVVTLRKMMTLDVSVQRELRIPVRFDSFIYPLDDSFKGRKTMVSIDLSCGGMSFYSDSRLELGQTVETVIPVTTNPLVVTMEILRKQMLNDGRAYYAARFVDLLEEEEKLICEAVFGIQLRVGREKEMLLR